jgi:hypothetical protein
MARASRCIAGVHPGEGVCELSAPPSPSISYRDDLAGYLPTGGRNERNV